jgi:hypothetical protein
VLLCFQQGSQRLCLVEDVLEAPRRIAIRLCHTRQPNAGPRSCAEPRQRAKSSSERPQLAILYYLVTPTVADRDSSRSGHSQGPKPTQAPVDDRAARAAPPRGGREGRLLLAGGRDDRLPALMRPVRHDHVRLLRVAVGAHVHATAHAHSCHPSPCACPCPYGAAAYRRVASPAAIPPTRP